MMSGDSEEYNTDSDDDSLPPVPETSSLPDLDEEGYPGTPASDMIVHSAGTGAYTMKRKR